MIALEPDVLRGSYPSLVTPFAGHDVDYDAFGALVDRQIRGGSHGVVVNGGPAEATALTGHERDELVRVAVEAADGRVPVVAAVGCQSHDHTCSLAVHAAAVGADALLVVTPYYSRPPARGLVAYYRDIGARTALPLLVHHVPDRSGVTLTADTIEAIADTVETFAGVLHEAIDLALVASLRRRIGDDVRIFAGLDALSLPMLAAGAVGLAGAVGNLAPASVAALWEAIVGGDLDAARKQDDALSELHEAMTWDATPVVVKHLLARLGILATNEHRLPMAPPCADLAARLDDLLLRTGLA